MKENADKARGLDAAELDKQLRDGVEQLFRLRFQMSMGQTDGLKKYRALRKERARMLTVIRERELGQEKPVHTHAAPAPEAKAKPVKKAKPVEKAKPAEPAAKAEAKPVAAKKPAAARKPAVAKASPKPAAAVKPRKQSSKG